MKAPKAETTVVARGAMPSGDRELEEAADLGASSPAISRRELAALWSELLAAAPTDARARKFVAYFRPDAERLLAADGARQK
jgi:hypothetical protein